MYFTKIISPHIHHAEPFRSCESAVISPSFRNLVIFPQYNRFLAASRGQLSKSENIYL